MIASLAGAPVGSCAADPPAASAAPAPATGSELRVRAPDLSRPLSEILPAPEPPREPVRARVFERINADRAAAGVAPVAWDESAARVAEAFCRQQVAERSRGHFLMNGIPPYARTAFAGIFGLQSENSVSWITTAPEFSEPAVKLALDGEEQMMAERPPRDGHRQTILDPDATHVGVGWALERGRFQLAEEFLARRLERLTLSLPDRRHAAVRFEGKPASGERLRFVVVAREAEPVPLSRAEASARTSYAYPPSYIAYIPEGTTLMRVAGLPNDDRLRIGDGREFSFLFSADRPGLYTLTFYVSRTSENPRAGGSATLWVERAT